MNFKFGMQLIYKSAIFTEYIGGVQILFKNYLEETR